LPLPDFEFPIGNSRPDFLRAVEALQKEYRLRQLRSRQNFARRKRTLLNYCGRWSDFQPVAVWKMYDEYGYISAPNQLRWFLRSFVEYCVNRGWLAESDWKAVCKILRKVVPLKRVQIPAPTEVRDLLVMCEADSFEQIKCSVVLPFKPLIARKVSKSSLGTSFKVGNCRELSRICWITNDIVSRKSANRRQSDWLRVDARSAHRNITYERIFLIEKTGAPSRAFYYAFSPIITMIISAASVPSFQTSFGCPAGMKIISSFLKSMTRPFTRALAVPDLVTKKIVSKGRV
jgi:hypothetical protein